MALKFKFKTNVPARMTFSQKASDWFGEKRTHAEYGDSYAYKVHVHSDGGYEEDPNGVVYTTPILHGLIQSSGVQRGDTIFVSKVEDEEDTKKKIWRIQKGDQFFSSGSGAKPEAPTPTTTPPEQTETPHPPSPPPPAPTGYSVPQFSEIACIAWKAHRASLKIWESLGIAFDAANVQASANSIAIACDRAKVRPTERDMEAFIAAMRPTPAQTSTPTPATESPAGSGPIGSDEYFDLAQQAQEAGISPETFESDVRRIVADHLKVKKLPATYDLAGMPTSLIPKVVEWINAADAFRRSPG